MAHREFVNEQTTCYITVNFKDKDEIITAPTSAVAEINCLTTGTEMRASASITAAGTVEITVTPAQNAINDSNNGMELRELTATATYGVSDSLKSRFRYYVRNLKAIS